MLHETLAELNNRKLESYRADPGLLKEHFGVEKTVLAGGYGYRQVLELVQNGADALLEAHEDGSAPNGSGRVCVKLCESRLYVANTGAPLSAEGLDALLRSHSSPKRGNQIGRFGLGFKSLLKLNGQIDIFTRSSGAIRFDPNRCRTELQRSFQVQEAPGLRLAWPLPENERVEDPICGGLEWAETIVRVEVRSENLRRQIQGEIASFPVEFLLFFPVNCTLDLDSGEQPTRVARTSREGCERILHDGNNISRWRLETTDVRITDAAARDDATHIHVRETVPVSWAMPIEGRRDEVGRFWAFFPTQTQTYLPGVLNAPWKLNSDRNAIISGEWNTALMQKAAQLIADTLPSLANPRDPGRLLDAFPRRLDRQEDTAAPLVNSLWSRLVSSTIVPDGTGALRCAKDVWRHPNDTRSLATTWQTLAGPEKRCRLVHASCLEGQRASRLNHLAERIDLPDADGDLPMLRRLDTKSWFDWVASTEAEASLHVLKLAEQFSERVNRSEWDQARPTLAIIPTQSGDLAKADSVCLAPESVPLLGREAVAVELQSNREAKRILRDVLRVSEPSDGLWASKLRAALHNAVRSYARQEAEWTRFWSLLRCVPMRVRTEFLNTLDHSVEVRVRLRDGRWAPLGNVLLPGKLVGEGDGPPNSDVLVDLDFHCEDNSTLQALGVTDVPTGTFPIAPKCFNRDDAEHTRNLHGWLYACRERYRARHSNSARWSHLAPKELQMPLGYALLAKLKGESNARFTHRLGNQCTDLGICDSIRFGHSTRDTYPPISVPHPLAWYLVEHGNVVMGSSTVPLRAVFQHRDQPALRSLPNWTDIDSLLRSVADAFPSSDVTKPSLTTFWHGLINAIVNPDHLADAAAIELWRGAAEDGFVPANLPSSEGPIPLRAAFVTTSATQAKRVGTPKRMVVVLDPSTMQLWVDKGAKDLAELMNPQWDSCVAPPELLTDVEPELAAILRTDSRERALCQRVMNLRLKIENTAQPAPCLMGNNALLLDTKQLDELSHAERAEHLIAELGESDWLDCTPSEALSRLGDAKVRAQRATIAEAQTLPERLLRAVGARKEPLLDALGKPVSDLHFVRRYTPLQLADLVLGQLGPAALSKLRATLEAEGLQPPEKWGTAQAREFIAAIGFPADFASSAEAPRESEELISGPIELLPLHDFQEEVFRSVQLLLESGSQRRRAVISLPTGAGKTRVMVEAAVRLVLTPKGNKRSVIWIAQTDELCEQAVQAFRQVWVNRGAQHTDLRIARLWGGNHNPREGPSDKPVVVVASIQTLIQRVGKEALKWLQKPGLVVLDECHHAIAPSYSKVLHWLVAATPLHDAPMSDEPAIFGLSATPFRVALDEKRRLARRFDNRWFPNDHEKLYPRLLNQGVLAQVNHESLDTGVSLTSEELAQLSELERSWEGVEFENLLNAINKRFAGINDRNKRLLRCITTSAERSILFFTNSVEHAEEMAARLNDKRVTAAAISGSTPTVARRYFLERFQSGELRVLCNHSVLTAGFDAPKTDMVLIARHVFSPVRYMQMVGRGLRGAKNGGTPSCRIVTVLDNLDRFGAKHPYHYCQHLYHADA